MLWIEEIYLNDTVLPTTTVSVKYIHVDVGQIYSKSSFPVVKNICITANLLKIIMLCYYANPIKQVTVLNDYF